MVDVLRPRRYEIPAVSPIDARVLDVEVAERRRAEHALQALLRISQKLHASLDLDTLLDDLVLESLDLVGAEGGYAGLRTAEGMVSARYFRRSECLPWSACWPSGHGLPGWLLEHRRPYIVNDALADEQIGVALCLQLGVRSALSTPILDAQGEVLGFFELHNRLMGPVSPRPIASGWSPSPRSPRLRSRMRACTVRPRMPCVCAVS
jgi:GAF domain-containing protein